MNWYRNSFVSWSVSLILLIGLATHLVSPASDKVQKSAFAQWLDQSLATGDRESGQGLRDHIRELYSQHDAFPNFLKQATQLVLENRNEFRLPHADSGEDADRHSLWLLQTWTLQRDLPGKMSTLLNDPVKPVMKWAPVHQPFAGVALPAGSARSFSLSMPLPELPAAISRALTPFLSGISINAP